MLLSKGVLAQDFPYGKITKEDFSDFKIDSAASAIVLREYGSAAIELASGNKGLVLRNYTHKKILILKKEGFTYADFGIKLYKSENSSDREFLSGLKGTTYNLIDGKIVETDIDKKNILTEKISNSLSEEKVAFPDVKEGSIIELKYTVESPYLYNLSSWSFQGFIPKIYSEFETRIPVICHYNVNMRGAIRLDEHRPSYYSTNIEVSTGEVLGNKVNYIMKNIPAFVIEDYITSPRNYLSSVNFELASYSIPFGTSYNFNRTWVDVEKQLMESSSFGKELKRKNVFKTQFASLLKSDMSDLEKATTIYNYIKNTIRWDKNGGMYADKGIIDALEKKNGNVADINLALVNALREAKLNAFPVVLSTRENGFPSFTSPSLSDFNYVVASLNIDSVNYLLDATDKNMPFGLLPYKCINFMGRTLDNPNPDWIALQASFASSVSHTFEGALSEEGKLTGNLNLAYNGYQAVNKRSEIDKSNSVEEYFEEFDEKNTAFRILKSSLVGLGNAENSLTKDMNIEVGKFAHTHGDKLMFNPFFIGATHKNPFNLEERLYPVDLGATMQESFRFVLTIPKGYELENPPKGINMSLPDKSGRYIYKSALKGDVLEIEMNLILNKASYLPEEYLTLKEFFSRVIQSQKMDYTLVKQ